MPLSFKDFCEKSKKLAPSERKVKYREMAEKVAEMNGWTFDGKISKMNGRNIYKDGNGTYYSLDDTHGTWEVCDKNGKHQKEINWDGETLEGRDPKGKHDIKVK